MKRVAAAGGCAAACDHEISVARVNYLQDFWDLRVILGFWPMKGLPPPLKAVPPPAIHGIEGIEAHQSQKIVGFGCMVDSNIGREEAPARRKARS